MNDRRKPQPLRRPLPHELKCSSCQGILAVFGHGDVKCFGIQNKSLSQGTEIVPIKNKKAPYVIVGLSVIMSGKAGTKNIQTQWAVPGRSQLTNWESQKKLRSKISKGFIQNTSHVTKNFIPKCSYICSTIYSLGVNIGKKITESLPRGGKSN